MKTNRGRLWASGVLIALLGASTIFLECRRSGLKRDLAQVRREQEALESRRARIDRIRDMRSGYLRNQYFLDHPKKYLSGLIRFIRHLEGEIGSGASYGRLTAIPAPGTFLFTLLGEMRSAGKSESLIRYDSFLEGLKTFDALDQVFSSETICGSKSVRFSIRGSVFVP